MIDFPSSGFNPVCIGDKRKNRCPECLRIIFHDMTEVFFISQEIYTVNTLREGERRPEGMSLCFLCVFFLFFIKEKVLMKMNNPH